MTLFALLRAIGDYDRAGKPGKAEYRIQRWSQ